MYGVAHGGGVYLVLAKWNTSAFEQLSWNSLSLQQRRQQLHAPGVLVNLAAKQQGRLARLLSSSKMTNIIR